METIKKTLLVCIIGLLPFHEFIGHDVVRHVEHVFEGGALSKERPHDKYLHLIEEKKKYPHIANGLKG